MKDEDIFEKYSILKEESERYKEATKEIIDAQNIKIGALGKKLDVLTNIVEISKYINSSISDENLIPMINDMIIGILGVTYSSIYLEEKDQLVEKASNLRINLSKSEFFNELKNGQPFIVNSRESIFVDHEGKEEIHSLIGVPITLREKFLGYILLQHTLYNFFDYDHIKFLSSISNQIGIALENNILYKKIKDTSIRDPLIGIYDRRYFFSLVEEIISTNNDKKFAVAMMDFDNFKKINDVYGHQFGDIVLIETTQLIISQLGKKDIIARYGGEELIIFIDEGNNEKEVFNKIDDIRSKISRNVVEYGPISKCITASFGLSFYPKNGTTLNNIISVADKMLYESKKAGKNRVT